jgi:hypothetical protein
LAQPSNRPRVSQVNGVPLIETRANSINRHEQKGDLSPMSIIAGLEHECPATRCIFVAADHGSPIGAGMANAPFRVLVREPSGSRSVPVGGTAVNIGCAAINKFARDIHIVERGHEGDGTPCRLLHCLTEQEPSVRRQDSHPDTLRRPAN